MVFPSSSLPLVAHPRSGSAAPEMEDFITDNTHPPLQFTRTRITHFFASLFRMAIDMEQNDRGRISLCR